MSASPDNKAGTLADGSVDARRRGARRTAIVLGLIAFAVYGGFILSGMLAR